MLRLLAPLTLAASLSACATTGALPPTEVQRYHLGEPIDRGTIAVEPLAVAPGAPPTPVSLEFRSYAAAVERELLRNGYARPIPGQPPQLIATVNFTRANRLAPPRRSPVSIGIGGGGFSGGRRGGGVGLGGGVGFPLGGGGAREVIETELAVTIKRRADQSPVWEGRAHGFVDPRANTTDGPAQADRLATALFTGFPGESGRTIEVK
jgi:hypothetical protein